jgi:hypothetical protein
MNTEIILRKNTGITPKKAKHPSITAITAEQRLHDDIDIIMIVVYLRLWR